jgi:SP family myo-inositol transporter-like MFS transporter 13
MSSEVTPQLLLLGFNAAVGGFLFGYDISSMNGALLQLKRPRGANGLNNLCPGLASGPLSIFEQEMVTAFVTLGAFLSVIVAGELNTIYGRRPVLVAGAAIFALGASFMAFSQGLEEMLAARFVVGIGVGISSHTVPLYISECAPVHLRGSFCFLNDMMIVAGQVTAASVSTGFFYWEVRDGWRWILGMGALPALMMFAGLMMQPESPRWLLTRGKEDEARTVLQLFRGKDADMTEFDDMLQDARHIGAHQHASESFFQIIFKSHHCRRALLLGCGLHVLQQWVGVNTIMFYGASVLEHVNPTLDVRVDSCFTPENKRSVALTVLFATSQLVGVFCSWYMVDRLGRRPLVLASLIGAALSLAGIGGVFSVDQVDERLVVICVLLYLMCFGFGMSPVPWTVNAEIYPLRARARCLSLATSVHFLMNFLVVQSFLSLGSALSTDRSHPLAHPNGVFFLYSAIASSGFVILWRFMPETRGVPLEHMSSMFVNPEEKGLDISSKGSDLS